MLSPFKTLALLCLAIFIKTIGEAKVEPEIVASLSTALSRLTYIQLPQRQF